MTTTQTLTVENKTGGELPMSGRDLVRKHYESYAKRLQGYYRSLLAALEAHAPELRPMLASPQPPRHGYQILPKIIAEPLPAEQRLESAWYSWPSTDSLIQRELMEIARSESELKRAAAISSVTRKSVYEKLSRSYRQFRQGQHNIDAHIQYNRLWQAAIAEDRSGYDRETLLHDAVLERQAILDVLKAPDTATFKKSLVGLNRMNGSRNLAELKTGLIEREKRLARDIHQATGAVSIPPFIRVERGAPGRWVLHVPFYTDIDDQGFVESVKKTIETIWHLRDGEDEFRVELAISFISLKQLSPERQPPQKGDPINLAEHLALFPRDGALLTTGAITTHVYGRAIILGPHDIEPRVLAHEFGHILGFRDGYFRGYRDLGKNGFQVMEVVAEPNDIMGAPGTGAVLRSHFERILEQRPEGKIASASQIVMPRASVRRTKECVTCVRPPRTPQDPSKAGS